MVGRKYCARAGGDEGYRGAYSRALAGDTPPSAWGCRGMQGAAGTASWRRATWTGFEMSLTGFQLSWARRPVRLPVLHLLPYSTNVNVTNPAKAARARVARFPTAAGLSRYSSGSAFALHVPRSARRSLALWPARSLECPWRSIYSEVWWSMVSPPRTTAIACGWSEGCLAAVKRARQQRRYGALRHSGKHRRSKEPFPPTDDGPATQESRILSKTINPKFKRPGPCRHRRGISGNGHRRARRNSLA